MRERELGWLPRKGISRVPADAVDAPTSFSAKAFGGIKVHGEGTPEDREDRGGGHGTRKEIGS